MSEQFVIRPVREEDLDQIFALAETANPGLTNLLPDRTMIQSNIQWSVQSFPKNITAPESELYFFVMEELHSKKVVGTCGIFSDVGDDFYSFRVSREMAVCESLKMRRENHYLQLVNDYSKVSEFALLLVQRKLRKMGLGKFLSRSRYLFMADYPNRFHPHLIAEMRGQVDLFGNSLFWDAVGSRFIDLKFTEADYLTASHHKHFITELLPHTPIPVALLAKSAQKVIGQPHRDTQAAVSVLLAEGFEFSHYVDIFDGGPTLEGVVKNLRTVAQSRRAEITSTEFAGKGVPCMMSFQGQAYRIGLGECLVQPEGTVMISSTFAQALGCSTGDTIRYIFL